jgi:hypothetical protein
MASSGSRLERLMLHGFLQSSNMLPQSYGGFDQSPMSAMAYDSLHAIHYLFPLSEARLHCPHLFSMRDASPDRPGMWGRVRRLRCRRGTNTGCAVCPGRRQGNEPASGVLEPHALSGTPEVVGGAEGFNIAARWAPKGCPLPRFPRLHSRSEAMAHQSMTRAAPLRREISACVPLGCGIIASGHH